MRASTALALLLASSVGSAAAAAPKPPPCPGGRFVVQGGALLANPISFADDVYFSATQIAVASGCTGAPVKLKGSKRGTTVKATWETCNGVTGKVKLKAKVDPTCQTLTGTLSAKKQRPKLKRKFTATLVASAVRECDYLPGVSQPATMPPEVTDPPDPPPPPPPDPPPGPTAVSPETTAAQLDVFDGLWNAVNDEYVDPGFNGVDWGAVGDGYEQLVEAGLSDEDFAKAMALMVGELGDGHSYYQSPQVVADEEAAMAAGLSFVGIGVLALPLPDQTGGSLIVVFPGSPADEAGLRVHDLMLMVDGGPVRDEFGISRTRGPAGTSFMLTYSRGSGAPQTIQLTREAVSGFLPIDSCIVPGTRIGYVLLPTFLFPPVPEQVRRALQDMTLEGPLAGLVVDNRMNGGGLGSVTAATLGFFTAGVQGRYVGRSGERPLEIVPEDVGGSQSVPLVVMTDRDTVSNGEIFSGVLQVAGRATIVGGPSAGNVETLHEFDFPDASRAWLAAETFAPNGMAPGAWEGVGILPDAEVRTRWDLFTEETDPALAAAVELLLP